MEIVGLILTALGGFGAFIVWLVNQVMKLGEMNAQIQYILKNIDHQVTNHHDTNLRDDISEIKNTVNNLVLDNIIIHNKLDEYFGEDDE